MIRQEVLDHVLLHLQNIRRELNHTQPPLTQVESDIYEIGEHLGFSPKEVNADVGSNHK